MNIKTDRFRKNPSNFIGVGISPTRAPQNERARMECRTFRFKQIYALNSDKCEARNDEKNNPGQVFTLGEVSGENSAN